MGQNEKMVPTLETERLVLRGITGKDADCIVLWRSDKSVYQYFRSPHRISREEHVSWYEKIYMTDDTRLQWMGFRKDTDEKIGVFGIKREKDKRQEAEISYLLARQSRHCGFGSEAVGSLVRWCKENGIMRIKAVIHEENRDSMRFIESMGFCREGRTECFILYEKRI